MRILGISCHPTIQRDPAPDAPCKDSTRSRLTLPAGDESASNCSVPGRPADCPLFHATCRQPSVDGTAACLVGTPGWPERQL